MKKKKSHTSLSPPPLFPDEVLTLILLDRKRIKVIEISYTIKSNVYKQ